VHPRTILAQAPHRAFNAICLVVIHSTKPPLIRNCLVWIVAMFIITGYYGSVLGVTALSMAVG